MDQLDDFYRNQGRWSVDPCHQRRATSVFSPEEVEFMNELWDEHQAEGLQQSGYYFYQ